MDLSVYVYMFVHLFARVRLNLAVRDRGLGWVGPACIAHPKWRRTHLLFDLRALQYTLALDITSALTRAKRAPAPFAPQQRRQAVYRAVVEGRGLACKRARAAAAVFCRTSSLHDFAVVGHLWSAAKRCLKQKLR